VTSLTGGLSDSISQTLNLVGGVVNAAMLKLTTEPRRDVLVFLKPNVQKFGSNSQIKDWNHRRTGEFARALVRPPMTAAILGSGIRLMVGCHMLRRTSWATPM
jgi:hypothetical protein